MFRHDCPLTVKLASTQWNLVKKTWRDSAPIGMFFSAVYVLVVVQLSSEVPEGLMNNTVFLLILIIVLVLNVTHHRQKCCGERWSRNTSSLQQLKFYRLLWHQIGHVKYKWTEEPMEMATRSRHDFRNTEKLKFQVTKQDNLLRVSLHSGYRVLFIFMSLFDFTFWDKEKLSVQLIKLFKPFWKLNKMHAPEFILKPMKGKTQCFPLPCPNFLRRLSHHRINRISIIIWHHKT
jgi:hypothetical protein